MAEWTDYLENEVLDHVLGEGARDFASPTTLFVALSTSTISDDGTGITEPGTGGYARVAVTFNAAASGVASNDANVDFVAGAGGFGTVVAMAIYNASTAGDMLMYDNDMTDTLINDGDTLRFATGDIDVSLD